MVPTNSVSCRIVQIDTITQRGRMYDMHAFDRNNALRAIPK